MKRGRVDISQWVLHVLCWDGLLPVVILLLNWALSNIELPANEWLELLPILICIAGIFARLYSGIRIISRHHVSPGEQQGQRFFLLFGAKIMAVIDTCLLSIVTLPVAMRPQPDPMGLTILLWLFAAYLVCLTIAMYPGRKLTIVGDPEPRRA